MKVKDSLNVLAVELVVLSDPLVPVLPPQVLSLMVHMKSVRGPLGNLLQAGSPQ